MMQLTQRQEPRLELKLVLPMDSAGELELLSWHRIKNRWDSLEAAKPVKDGVRNGLLKANQEYREEEGHDRYCITPQHVDTVVDKVYDDITDAANVLASHYERPREIRENLYSQADNLVKPVKNWFSENYDELIYDTSGKIPWPVVVQMRTRFRVWSQGESGVFDVPITKVLYDAARELNIDPSEFDSDLLLWEHLKDSAYKTSHIRKE